MKKPVTIASFAVVGVLIVGFLAWAFVLPQFTNRTANEPAPAAEKVVPTDKNSTATNPPEITPTVPSNKGGIFIGVGAKKAGGNVTVQDKTIRLESNFTVQNAPDLRVYVGTLEKPVTEIAPLKANNGAQNYELPANIKPESVSYVWIHCKQFNESYATAQIK